MSQELTHAEMIKGWSDPRQSTVMFLAALNKERERRGLKVVEYWTVRSWIHRDSIPSEMWISVAAAAQRDGVKGVTLKTLAEAAERKAVGEPPRGAGKVKAKAA